MHANEKSEIKRLYKETATRKGIFKVHDRATGQTWVDASPTLDTIKNRIWFTLRMGSHPNQALQQAWNASGPESVAFEILEVFPEDASGYALERLTRERKQHWFTQLGAQPYQ